MMKLSPDNEKIVTAPISEVTDILMKDLNSRLSEVAILKMSAPKSESSRLRVAKLAGYVEGGIVVYALFLKALGAYSPTLKNQMETIKTRVSQINQHVNNF